MITYEKMSLFDAPIGAIIIHACNAQGVWGSGIAKEFKTMYPKSYEHYQDYCRYRPILGRGRLSMNPVSEAHHVGWIITSENYGDKKDGVTSILANTALALDDLCEDIYTKMQLSGLQKITIYSNRFNSGLFNVPWSDTECVLQQVLKHYPFINWVICDPKLDEWA